MRYFLESSIIKFWNNSDNFFVSLFFCCISGKFQNIPNSFHNRLSERVANFDVRRISLSTNPWYAIYRIALRFLYLYRHVRPIGTAALEIDFLISLLWSRVMCIAIYRFLCFVIFELNENVLDIKQQDVAAGNHFHNNRTYFQYGENRFFFYSFFQLMCIGHLLLPYYAISREQSLTKNQFHGYFSF